MQEWKIREWPDVYPPSVLNSKESRRGDKANVRPDKGP
jgi:hypothetical protein